MSHHAADKYSNKSIAYLLRSIAAAYLIKNGNRFKIIAYENAADTVEHLVRELKDIWQEGKIKEIPGLGPSISAHLAEYFKTGKSAHFDEVKKGIPDSVFVLLDLRSIGPKRAVKLVESLKLNEPKTVIKDLKKASLEGKVALIPTFGKKSEEDILEAIRIYEGAEKKQARMPLPYAFSIAEMILKHLKKHPKVMRADALGSLRRMVATIGDVDVAVAVKKENEADEVVKHFISYPKTVTVDNAGEKKASIIIAPATRIDLRIQTLDDYGSMLQYFTGSKFHNIRLREYALKKGFSLSEYAIKRVKESKKGEILKFRDEEGFYRFLGLQYIPPEIREGTDEISLAENSKLPHLVELTDIKGDLHLHSSYDIEPSHDVGANRYDQILDYAVKKGYQYVGFADHNPSINKHSLEETVEILKKRKEYIDKIISAKKVDRSRYFIGLEVDILPDGSLAISDKALPYVDYLIASVHSSFNMNISQMTKRVIAGLERPKVKILGHLTGRMLGEREGYELEWNQVFKLCRDKKVALEINAWPERLDLPDTLVRDAVVQGVKLAVNSDAHANYQMDNLFFGVAVARRGWAKKNDIINSMAFEEIKKWIKS
jgi:DNA polymerase (family 10)